MEQSNLQRRRWLSLGGIILGASLLPGCAKAALSTAKPLVTKGSRLSFRNINTGDVHLANFSANGVLAKADLGKLNYLMRDRRTNQVRAIDPHLFIKLHQIHRKLGVKNAEILVISGYRSPKTNAQMRSRSRGVASNSYHIQGKAVDFRIANVPLARIKAVAESLNSGGVGYYPRSNFIHVDTGPARTWRGA